MTPLQKAEKKSGLQQGDVLQVAKDLKMKTPTDEQVIQVLDEHMDYCEDDPTEGWDQVIEQQLSEMLR